jgi:peptidoglycan/xylan/chitin deacetylase (PgdA/CDA1 family)
VRASIWGHGAAIPTLAMLPFGQWIWVAAALLANHAALAAFSLSPQSQVLGPTLRRLPGERGRQGVVALTFDDGPDPEVTPRVLDLLDEYEARASFFCIGARAAKHPELVKEIALRGHTVENHTWSHRYGFAFLGLRAMAREIQRTQDLLTRLTGMRPRWVRAPAGLRGPLLDPVLTRLGVAHASWTRRGFDTACRDPARVLARLTRGLAAGDVLLLHDADYDRAGVREPVVTAVLPGLLQAITAAGLRAVALPDPDRQPCRLGEAGVGDFHRSYNNTLLMPVSSPRTNDCIGASTCTRWPSRAWKANGRTGLRQTGQPF